MDEYDRHRRMRTDSLRLCNCTPVHLERRRQQLNRAWRALHSARKRLARSKQTWFDNTPRPLPRNQPFCFVLRRMRRTWREADRVADLSGLAVHHTIGSTDARKTWFPVLNGVLVDDEVIRIRHRSYDKPAVLIKESRFRKMEQR